jgi:hypothetical protein
MKMKIVVMKMNLILAAGNTRKTVIGGRRA